MGLLGSLLGGGAGASVLENVVMAALSHQGGAAQPGQPVQQEGVAGGLGGLATMLGSLMAGQGQGQGAAQGVAQSSTGLQGLLASFTQNGLGNVAQSWVGSGSNEPVSPDQVHSAFGDDKVQAIVDHTGMDKQDVLAQLAQMLPGMIDKMTPHGRVPV